MLNPIGDFSEQARRQIQALSNMPSISDTWGSPKIYDHIMSQIRDFEKTLDREHELGVLLQLSGSWYNIVVLQIVALPPTLIMFKGVMTNPDETHAEVRLLQHINQVNLLLRKVKRANPEDPKRPIGFIFKEE
jgi:hypothetical protein